MQDHNEDLWKVAIVLALGAIILFVFMALVLPGGQTQTLLRQQSDSVKLSKMFDRMDGGIVLCYSNNTRTTGFFISKDGWIMTAGHKVDREFPQASKIYVRLAVGKNNNTFIVDKLILPKDRQLDLALLKINYKPNYYFKKFRRPYLYEENWVFGFRGPSGKVPTASGFVTFIYGQPNFLLTTARIWYGNSGSPVVNRWERVIGVAVRILASMDGVFIPGDVVEKFIDESGIRKKGN